MHRTYKEEKDKFQDLQDILKYNSKIFDSYGLKILHFFDNKKMFVQELGLCSLKEFILE